jgi:tungsten cofactor oxidoreducase radical SAM maturase
MMPEKIYLELTDQCNLDCSTCYRKSWVAEPAEIHPALLDKITDEISNSPETRTVVLGGMGEPLEAKCFDKAVNALEGKDIWVTTNGTLFFEKLDPRLLEKTGLFIVSADGMHHNMQQIRGVDMEFWLRNIRHFNEMKKQAGLKKPYLDIQFVASKTNIQDIFPLMDLLAGLQVRNLVVSNLLPVDEAAASQILYRRYENQEVRKLFHQIRNYSLKLGLRVKLPEFELKTERRCAFVDQNAAYITSTGEVVPCYRLSHHSTEYVFGRPKTIQQYTFGDLNHQSLQEIWQNKEYRSFRDRVYNNHYPSCIDCELVDGCELVKSTSFDCYGVSPSCADCLWARNFVFCN